ncbi:MAG TPA: RNA polymerase sigma factor RpoD/SigA [Cyclobacteriaceae bacterium]|nr:RNA polymerase sigma factor RpoD/SigA [Cyclobacteriaceae bacterium]
MRQIKISHRVTKKEGRSIEVYLQEIGKVDLISTETEVELVKRIRAGDKIALERLTTANLRFVVSVAKQYQNRGLTLGDLINEGNLGLIKAAQRFDETRGFKFISYAVWWIRQSIIQAIGDKSKIIRTPLNRVGSLVKLNRTISRWEQKFEREPTSEELSQFLKYTSDQISETLRAGVYHVSIDSPTLKGEEKCLLDVLQDDSEETPDSGLIKESLCAEVKRFLSTLTKSESKIISLYFGLNGDGPMSLLEISKKFEVTRERARQIKESGINKLKNKSKSQLLKSYLS